jgi:hypothetical protein
MIRRHNGVLTSFRPIQRIVETRFDLFQTHARGITVADFFFGNNDDFDSLRGSPSQICVR